MESASTVPDVIENEAQLRASLHHLDGVRQMVVQDTDIEGEVARREELKAGDEVWPDAEVGSG